MKKNRCIFISVLVDMFFVFVGICLVFLFESWFGYVILFVSLICFLLDLLDKYTHHLPWFPEGTIEIKDIDLKRK